MKNRYPLRGLIWFVLGIGICIGSVKLNPGTIHKPGPGFMPLLSGGLLTVLGLILILSKLLKGSREDDARDEKIWYKGNWNSFLYTMSALFGYYLLLEPIGFILTTLLIPLFFI
ncbi:MAG: tripartite tricarboxylate transporter TctB family protein [Deltaproteobacteria bacterium]